MASLCPDPAAEGHLRICFRHWDGRRRTLHLGHCTRRQGALIKYHVENIIIAKALGLPVDEGTAQWLQGTCGHFRDRLAACGLAARVKSARLDDLCREAFQGRNIKPSTRTAYATATRRILAFFSPAKDARRITPADAEAFRDALRTSGLREATIRRTCGVARDIFSRAIKSKVLSDNPFSGLPVSVRGSPDRAHLVTAIEFAKLTAQCNDPELRVILALARWGGIRIPSEALPLRWADVDWDHGRVTIHSSKTAHHAGHDQRVIPLFPELRVVLMALRADDQPEPSDFVVRRHRGPKVNLRTQLGRLAHRAGLRLWPKPFVNLRATRDAELRRDYPAHIVRQWIGHSERVAQEHYLLAPEEQYFTQAAGVKSDAPNTALNSEKATLKNRANGGSPNSSGQTTSGMGIGDSPKKPSIGR